MIGSRSAAPAIMEAASGGAAEVAEGVAPPSRRGGSAGTRTGYHGTTKGAAQAILATGFKPSSGGMLGAGVYWSDDLEKARCYGDGAVLRLSVRPGKVKRIDSQGHPLQTSWRHTHDTAWVPGACGMVGSGRSENCTATRSPASVIRRLT